jgi:hypothetical protein
MSDTPSNHNVIDFQEKRRERIIKEAVKRQIIDPDAMVQLLQMHEFLLYITDMKNSEAGIDEETLLDLQEDIQVIREKFDELFEMIK